MSDMKAHRAAMERRAYQQVYGDWHLVQPLERRTTRVSEQTGFDTWFEPHQLGNSDYEDDVLPGSLARIRKAGQLEQLTSGFTHEGVTKEVHFVGPGGQDLRNKILGCRVWLTHDGAQSSERSQFDEHFTGVPRMSHWTLDQRIVGWWSLNDDVMWALDPHVAYDMVAAINGRS